MKKKTIKSKQSKCDELLFELDGNVSIIEKYKGKEIKRSVIDPLIVLKSLNIVLEQGLKSMEKVFPKVEKKNVKRSKVE